MGSDSTTEAIIINMTDTPVIARRLDLNALLQKKSHFLFGPRQSGKSFLIRHTLPNTRVYNLLDAEMFLALSQRPARMVERVPVDEPFPCSVVKPGSII